MSAARRSGIVDTGHPQLSIRNQCKLLDLQRSTYYYQPQGESEYNLGLMRVIDELFTNLPFLGSRQMRRMLVDTGHQVGRGRVRRLMRKMGVMAVFHKPRTSQPHPEHKIYPYLLRKVPIVRPNQVWCADITYIPMKRGFLYLVTVMDWYSRAVLSWRLSNTMDSDFCVAALEDAGSVQKVLQKRNDHGMCLLANNIHISQGGRYGQVEVYRKFVGSKGSFA